MKLWGDIGEQVARRVTSIAQSEDTRSAVLSWAVFMVSYHLACWVFEQLDRTGRMQQYKMFGWKNGLPTYWDMVPRVVANQTLILLPSMILVWPLTNTHSTKEASTGTSLLALGALAPLLHEVPFYLFHRFVLHSPQGVARLGHWLHHKAKAHSAISAMYMYSFDFVLEIVLPYVTPLVVLRRSRMLNETHTTLLLALGALGGLYEHSGYNFLPLVSSLDTRIHGMHHVYYSCSFGDGVGAPGLLDGALRTACGSVGAGAQAGRKLVRWLLWPTRL